MTDIPLIPRYKLLNIIGEGGMATVYLAIQESVNRKVAIKVLDQSLLSDKTFGERFFLEANIAAKLDHTNVIHVLDVDKHDDYFYMVMEYLPGDTLENKIQSGLSADQAVDYFLDVAEGLAEAHKYGIIHRDIKPANVLFRKGIPVLTDFGVARETTRDNDLTQFNAVIGTPKYMSPEQAQGKEINTSADVYSMGVLFFYMLTGEHPFTGDSPVEIAIKHQTENIPNLPDQLSHFQDVIDQSLAKSPDERISSVEDLSQLVRQCRSKIDVERTIPNLSINSISDSDKTIFHSRNTTTASNQTQALAQTEHLFDLEKNQSTNQTKQNSSEHFISYAGEQHAEAEPKKMNLIFPLFGVIAIASIALGIYLSVTTDLDSTNDSAQANPNLIAPESTPNKEETDQNTVQSDTPTDSTTDKNITQSQDIETSTSETPDSNTSSAAATIVTNAPINPEGFLFIPGGTFTMGGANFNERPKRSVNVDSFFLSEKEVSFQEYDKYAQETGRDMPNDMGWGRGARPVINVSWEDAASYASWHSKKTGLATRLPSEAEWEYAARSGSTTKYYWGDELIPDHAVCTGCVKGSHQRGSFKTASFAPNAFGLYDMLGNVREWVADCYTNNYFGASPNSAPRLSNNCPSRVYRGGGWSDGPNKIRSASRNGISKKTKNSMTGFRVAISKI